MPTCLDGLAVSFLFFIIKMIEHYIYNCNAIILSVALTVFYDINILFHILLS